jgi:rhodanese-related sulfurtransferase
MSTATTFKTVTCKELDGLAKAGRIELIDVRTPVEFREVHSVHARNVPLDSLDPSAVMGARANAEAPVYVICRSGSRSTKACEAFVAAGFTNVVNVDGGTNAWDQAGLPVKRGKKAVSLERQVRIAAGFLVFTGTTLGVFHHEYWLGLPAFVGAGLMFAGITDTCAMGMLIAKMPWNQVKETCAVPRAGDSEGGANSTGGGCCTT